MNSPSLLPIFDHDDVHLALDEINELLDQNWHRIHKPWTWLKFYRVSKDIDIRLAYVRDELNRLSGGLHD